MKVFSFTLFFTLFLLSCRNSNPNLPGGGGGGGRDATSNLDWNKASQASLEERVKTLAKSLSFHSPADTALEKRSPKAARITQDADLQVSWDDSEIKDLSKAKKHANENFLPRTGFLPPGSSEHLPATYLIEYKVISRKKSTPVFAIQCNNPQTPAHCTLVIDKKEQPQGGGQRDKTNEIQATITAQYEVPQPTAQNSPVDRFCLSSGEF